MAARYLVDTNLLVYALDRREPEKRERAREVLRRVAGRAALPAQALSEFANACLRKLERGPETVRREVERLLLAFPVLIWGAARLGRVGVVLSEDFDSGTVLDGVVFANPLDPAFDLAELG